MNCGLKGHRVGDIEEILDRRLAEHPHEVLEEVGHRLLAPAETLTPWLLELTPVEDRTPCDAERISVIESSNAGREVAAERPTADADPCGIRVGTSREEIVRGRPVALGVHDRVEAV